MEHKKYKPINPRDVFAVTVERTVTRDTREKMHYEYTARIEARPTGNEFIDIFAELVAYYGKRRSTAFAAIMGVPDEGLRATLTTLCGGAGIMEWTDAFVCVVAEELLSKTNWKVERIAREVGWSVGIFSHFFSRRYKCTATRWRRRAGVNW